MQGVFDTSRRRLLVPLCLDIVDEKISSGVPFTVFDDKLDTLACLLRDFQQKGGACDSSI